MISLRSGIFFHLEGVFLLLNASTVVLFGFIPKTTLIDVTERLFDFSLVANTISSAYPIRVFLTRWIQIN